MAGMTAPAPSRLITADEFLHMPENRGAELVDGRIVEKHMGNESSSVAVEIIFRIRLFLESHRIGRLFESENGLRIWPTHPNRVRKPDVTFVRSLSRPVKGWQTVVPDLVVEVVSPNDEAEDLEKKLQEYREAGIALIWVIYRAPAVRRS
jgi:Uma2 family endonuclease